jgi:hypothetical protein
MLVLRCKQGNRKEEDPLDQLLNLTGGMSSSPIEPLGLAWLWLVFLVSG